MLLQRLWYHSGFCSIHAAAVTCVAFMLHCLCSDTSNFIGIMIFIGIYDTAVTFVAFQPPQQHLKRSCHCIEIWPPATPPSSITAPAFPDPANRITAPAYTQVTLLLSSICISVPSVSLHHLHVHSEQLGKWQRNINKQPARTFRYRSFIDNVNKQKHRKKS